MTSKRGPEPTKTTIQLLWGRAAGRCQFAGCNKILSEDDVTGRKYNKSVVAHIVASSPDGPRGDPERSHKLSRDISNLLLLCPEHHHLIDCPEHSSDYPEAILQQMKRNHETAVRMATESVSYPETAIIRMVAAPHGRTEASIEEVEANLAVLADRRRPQKDGGVYIHLQEHSEYGTEEYWNRSVSQLERQFTQKVLNRLDETPSMHFSVFALAPIPLLAKLGHLMGDKGHAHVYQPLRNSNDNMTWVWRNTAKTNGFRTSRRKLSGGNRVALLLSLTAEVKEADVTEAYHPDSLFVIRVDRQGVDSIQSKHDLEAFVDCYVKTLDRIARLMPDAREIGVFPIMPASAAFSIGSSYMNDVWPPLLIFDNHNGFKPALTIGGNGNAK